MAAGETCGPLGPNGEVVRATVAESIATGIADDVALRRLALGTALALRAAESEASAAVVLALLGCNCSATAVLDDVGVLALYAVVLGIVASVVLRRSIAR